MKSTFFRVVACFSLIISNAILASAQTNAVDSSLFFHRVSTYVNPVLPGDHPDPTLLKVGDDFYHCGSSFHFTPYLPIYHSRDLVHWKIISRVIAPSKSGFVTDRPSAGIWQGAITFFYNSYWIYFSANGQWFSKASSPEGPWSEPVQVRGNPKTGSLGYDNSIFVDDDGKPYMVIKNGQKVNRVQALGRDGQLTDTVINMDWINAKLQYSWAEGPVMSKRNGFYFYFPAGDVTGGQYVLRGSALTADSTKWERLGEFFRPVTDPKTGFRRPNHISAPFQLADGTWWTIGQSYEKMGRDDWSGTGRQTSLFQVEWEGNRPWGMAPTTKPVQRPNLPKSDILWRSVQSDYFDTDSLNPDWHFLNKKAPTLFSLAARKGWITLTPDTARAHILQKETDHFYAAITSIDFNPADSAKAGLYLTNGNEQVKVQLYSGYNNGKKIIFRNDTAIRSIANPFGNKLWLKIERNGHELTGYCSGDGEHWIPVGASISSINLDKVQPNYNSWVGTSIGLFAEGKPGQFDFFICKDGFSMLQAAGYSNYFAVEKYRITGKEVVSNTSAKGGWLMISGVELGRKKRTAAQVEIVASSKTAGNLEIWVDDLSPGKLVATVPIEATGGDNSFRAFKKAMKKLSGHHDIFIKFPTGAPNNIYIESIRFSGGK